MKKFTERERTAAFDAIASITLSEMAEMTSTEIADAVLDAVDKAEDFPVGSGDKYIDAKNEVETSIKKLNKALNDASTIGLSINIDKWIVPGDKPPTADSVQFYEFKIVKAYKEF